MKTQTLESSSFVTSIRAYQQKDGNLTSNVKTMKMIDRRSNSHNTNNTP